MREAVENFDANINCRFLKTIWVVISSMKILLIPCINTVYR
jgi:hypothetical protein